MPQALQGKTRGRQAWKAEEKWPWLCSALEAAATAGVLDLPTPAHLAEHLVSVEDRFALLLHLQLPPLLSTFHALQDGVGSGSPKGCGSSCHRACILEWKNKGEVWHSKSEGPGAWKSLTRNGSPTSDAEVCSLPELWAPWRPCLNTCGNEWLAQ